MGRTGTLGARGVGVWVKETRTIYSLRHNSICAMIESGVAPEVAGRPESTNARGGRADA